MTKYLLGYHGGGMAATPAEQEASMAQWTAWFGALGGAVVDMGAPTGAARTVGKTGASTGGGANPLTGYSVIEAANLDAAVNMAKGCPIVTTGGTIEVSEIVAM
jgi:hypothetical protein